MTDLTKDAFRVFEDGKPQEITFFAHHSDVPMNVGVLLDTSTAMARTLGLEADAASSFFQTVMRPNDQGFLVSYASHIEVLQVPTEDAKGLSSKAQVIRKGARILMTIRRRHNECRYPCLCRAAARRCPCRRTYRMRHSCGLPACTMRWINPWTVS